MMRSSRQTGAGRQHDSRSFFHCETMEVCCCGNAPSARNSFDMCEIPLPHQANIAKRFVLVGGWCRGECNNVQKDHYYSDTYILDVTTQDPRCPPDSPLLRWTLLNTTGPVPTARANFT